MVKARSRRAKNDPDDKLDQGEIVDAKDDESQTVAEEAKSSLEPTPEPVPIVFDEGRPIVLTTKWDIALGEGTRPGGTVIATITPANGVAFNEVVSALHNCASLTFTTH